MRTETACLPRRRELAIRLALGATRGQVVALLVGRSLGLAAVGSLLGLLLSLGLGRFLESLLFGVEATDPVTLAAVLLLMFAVSLGTSYGPGRAAASTDPMVSLRTERRTVAIHETPSLRRFAMQRILAPALLVVFAALPACGQDKSVTQSEIAKVARRLETKAVDVSGVLSDPAYMRLHPEPAFRELILKHAPVGKVRMVTPEEPGEPMVVTATVLGADGKPAAGALAYVYQTNIGGLYTEDRSGAMGERDARLFSYVKTDAQGKFEVTTIRPGGYPVGNVPAHIHVEIAPQGGQERALEILFEDDPALTPARRRSLSDAFVIVPVQRQGGVQRVSPLFRLR